MLLTRAITNDGNKLLCCWASICQDTTHNPWAVMQKKSALITKHSFFQGAEWILEFNNAV